MAQNNVNDTAEETSGKDVFPEDQESSTLHTRKPTQSVRVEDTKDFEAAQPAALTRQVTEGMHRDSEEMLVEEGSEEEASEHANEKGDAVSPLTKKKRKVTTSDFHILCVIGMGAYGRVLQVQNKTNKKIYAMKVISKKLLQKKNHISYMQAERDIMTKVDHPFVVGLKCSFQTPDKMFLIMDYMPGGELFFHLDKEGFILEETARFYVAELVLALEFLHSINIIHRDLKPENILIDADGHIKVTDFGLAKEFSDSESSEDGTRTVCGTYEYMAPEMISKKGYSKAVDWWSLGTLMFEMMTGKPPFRGRNKENLMKKILSEKIKFPHWLTGEATSIMKAFLERNVQKRLGAQKSTMFKVGGTQAIKEHKFFTNAKLDWHCIEDLRHEAPIIPNIENLKDTSYFHEDFTSMELPRSLSFESNMSMSDVIPPNDDALHLYKGFSFIHPGWDNEQQQICASPELSSSPAKRELFVGEQLASPLGSVSSPRTGSTRLSPRATDNAQRLGSIVEGRSEAASAESSVRHQSTGSFTEAGNEKRGNAFRFLSISSSVTGCSGKHDSSRLTSPSGAESMQFHMEDLAIHEDPTSTQASKSGSKHHIQKEEKIPADQLNNGEHQEKPKPNINAANVPTSDPEVLNGRKYRNITKKEQKAKGNNELAPDHVIPPFWEMPPANFPPPPHFAAGPPPGVFVGQQLPSMIPPEHNEPFFEPYPHPPVHPHFGSLDAPNDHNFFGKANNISNSKNTNRLQNEKKSKKNTKKNWKPMYQNKVSMNNSKYPPPSSTRNIVDFPPMPGSDFPPMPGSNKTAPVHQKQNTTSWSNVVGKNKVTNTDSEKYNPKQRNGNLRFEATEWKPNASASEWKPPSRPW